MSKYLSLNNLTIEEEIRKNGCKISSDIIRVASSEYLKHAVEHLPVSERSVSLLAALRDNLNEITVERKHQITELLNRLLYIMITRLAKILGPHRV